MKDSIKIGGASGFWGDAPVATAQLLAGGGLDYIVYDYLAEITMAILARMRAKDGNLGYAGDFITGAMAPNLTSIAQQQVKVISNAGGVNPDACAAALRILIEQEGLDLKVAVVKGDDLMPQLPTLAKAGYREMFTGAAFPETRLVGSVNAYLGAFPIAAALASGADIVITGRCVDSAVTLGACIHAFGWSETDLDLLAAGSLAGHIIECGTQTTGGNFTDWESVADSLGTIGYPIVNVRSDGKFTVGKPQGSGGKVSIGTVAEQLVYEIGDPQNYTLPDVVCDFSEVRLTETGPDIVEVEGAIGRPTSDTYKTCLTWHDGFRGGHLFGYYGIDAERKAELFAKTALARVSAMLAQQNAPDFSETSVEILGAESQFGAARQSGPAREVNAKIAVRHPQAAGVGLFLKEATGLALSAPPGLSGFAGARPKPSPVMALYSFLLPKSDVSITIADQSGETKFTPPLAATSTSSIVKPRAPVSAATEEAMIEVPLIRLAWARSGDKGDSANIGVIARRPEYLPHIWAALDETAIAELFAHFLKGEVKRYHLRGIHAMNIVLTRVLGGGGTSSLRADPQAKGYAQLVLQHNVGIPQSLIES